jgi:outer membrane immunogenic protein
MKEIGLSILLAGISLPAFGADLALRAAPIPIVRFDWSGFYLGASAGYGWMTDGSDLTANMKGAFGGGQVGYNIQMNNVVFGIEADAHGGDIFQSVTSGGGVLTVTTKTEIGVMGGIRGRVGFAFDQVLLYGTAGAAIARNTISNTVVRHPPGPVGPPLTSSQAQWHSGWIVGGGVEVALNQNWSGKFEYLYTRYTAHDYFNGSVTPGDFDLSTVKAGINYRF